MKRSMIAVVSVVAVLAIANVALADTATITQGYEGWCSGVLFDFTQTREGYFGWDPLTISADYSASAFNFDITMPRDLSGGDNFDLVIDVNNNGTDDSGDFLVHYANNAPVDYWLNTWDAKTYQSGSGWVHQDALPTGVTATRTDAKHYNVTISDAAGGGNPISYAWLSPLGDEGFPASWCGEAVIISTWGPGGYVEVVPEPATLSLLALGGAFALIRRRRK